MKKVQLLMLLLCTFYIANTQTVVTTSSKANGTWTNPLTWACTCVPMPGSEVTIKHDVTLNTSFQIPANGKIIIDAGARLAQDADRDILMTGGSFQNSGFAEFRYLVVQQGIVSNTDTLKIKSFLNDAEIFNYGKILNVDSFYNSGDISNEWIIEVKKFQNNGTILNQGEIFNVDSFYNLNYIKNDTHSFIRTKSFFTSGNIDNFGTFEDIDSFVNMGVLANHSTGVIYADSMMNVGTFSNDGDIDNTAFVNTGNLQNRGNFHFKNGHNQSVFYNNQLMQADSSFWNMGNFRNDVGGVFNIAVDFLNASLITHNASFYNDGIVHVDSNWLNADTISGVSGSFVVGDSSANTGYMIGSFDFCDLTPPLVSPFIDFNTGTISPQITWCNPQMATANFVFSNICLGDVVQFTNTSSGAITHSQWNFGDGDSSAQSSPQHLYLNSGTFDVKLIVTNASGKDSVTHTITVFALPAQPQITVNGLVVSCNTIADTYEWYLDGSLRNGINTQSFTATQTGNYSVKIIDDNSCISEMSNSVFVDISSSISNTQNDVAIDIFPNPLHENILYITSEKTSNYSLVDITGRTIRQGALQAGKNTINIPNLQSGIYFVSIEGKGIKVIKE